MSCGETNTMTLAETQARTRASIDISFEKGKPEKGAEQRWFRCTHNETCGRCACEHLGIVPGEEATCELTTGVDSMKNALMRRDFKCPEDRF